ncbi:MAG: hypothetical protein WCO52_00490 [bacterium]
MKYQVPALYKRIDAFAKTPANALVAFLWGVCEGIFFFIVPDVYCAYITLFNRRAGWTAIGFSILGTLLASVVMYAVVVLAGNGIITYLLHVPEISRPMLDTVSNTLAAGGLAGLGKLHISRLILGAIPSKVYSSLAALAGIPLWAFLLWTIPMRILRLSWAMLLSTWLNGRYSASIKAHTKSWTVGYVIFWTVLHASYYVVVALSFHQ